LQVLELAGLAGPDQKLPPSVRVKHGTSNAGARLHFYLNYSPQPQSFAYPYGGGTELFTSKAVSPGSQIPLAPWDLAVIEERR
jgi:beta-galactosidase